MKRIIYLILVLVLQTEDLESETYIVLNGPIRTTKCSSNRMGGSPNYIRWQNSNIKWSINDNGCCQKDNISLSELEHAVLNGFNAWDTITTAQFDFLYEGFTSSPYADDGQCVVYWAEEGDMAYEEGEPLGGGNCGTLAITVITINEQKEILDVDIIFNGRDHVWKANDRDPDIWAVTTHEVGHLLGIFHTDLQKLPVTELPTMIYYYNSLFYRDLTFDDCVAASFLYGGNLIDDEVFKGNVYLKWRINVLPGRALIIAPGSVIKFFDGVSIRVFGELHSVGKSDKKISFLKYGNKINWSGIVFMPRSNGTMNYCNISDVKIYGGGAMTINNSSPQIQNCLVENNMGYCHGICVINHASPKIYGTIIRSNSGHGIYIYNSNPSLVKNNISASFNEGIAAVYCDYHSAPIFGTTCPPIQGNNVLTGSYYGVYATNGSMPCAGQVDFANNNTITGNSFANAYAKDKSVIYAINNSWGSEFSKIIAEKGSHIYYTPYLDEEHNKYKRAMIYSDSNTITEELQQMEEDYSKFLSSEQNNSANKKNELMNKFFSHYNQSQFSSAKNIVDMINSKFSSETDVSLASWLLNSEGLEVDQNFSEDESRGQLGESESVGLNNNRGFTLYQNWPNAFNATTKIKYEIHSNVFHGMTPVVLKIYDISGAEVLTLVNEDKTVGVYEVEFNGQSLSSGVYLYQLSVGNRTHTKKMILLK